MSHATNEATTATASLTAQAEVCRHLTESVLTLQLTIRNVRQDVQNGIAPSILMPADSESSLENGIVFFSLEPSKDIVESQIGPLDNKLHDLEEKLRGRGQWQPPPTPPKSPEYSIIDISDLSAAIQLLEDISEHAHPSKSLSPRLFFSKYKWAWDTVWKEWFTTVLDQSTFIYLSRWRLVEQSQVWEHIAVADTDLKAESGAQLLGSWDDWTWDPRWKEWYLDVSDEDGKTCVFTSRWQIDEDNEWVHIGRFGNIEV